MAIQTTTVATSSSWVQGIQRSYETSIPLDDVFNQAAGTICRLIQFIGLFGTQRTVLVFSNSAGTTDRNIAGNLATMGSVTLTNAAAGSITLNLADADNSTTGFYVFTSAAAQSFAVQMSVALADAALTVTFDDGIVTGQAVAIT